MTVDSKVRLLADLFLNTLKRSKAFEKDCIRQCMNINGLLGN